MSKIILYWFFFVLFFCITTLCGLLQNVAPFSPPIRSKTKTNRDLLAHVFPIYIYIHLALER